MSKPLRVIFTAKFFGTVDVTIIATGKDAAEQVIQAKQKIYKEMG